MMVTFFYRPSVHSSHGNKHEQKFKKAENEKKFHVGFFLKFENGPRFSYLSYLNDTIKIPEMKSDLADYDCLTCVGASVPQNGVRILLTCQKGCV